MPDQLSPEDMALVQQVAAQQLGDPQGQPIPQQGAQPQAAPAQQPAPDTAQEQATKNLSPQTDAKADPFEFLEVEINGKKELMTPAQLRGMAPRYKELNYKHQTEIAPIQNTVGFLNQLRQQAEADGTPVTDDDLAVFLQNAINAFVKNPTMGQQTNPNAQPGSPQRQNVDINNQAGSNPNPNNDIEAQLAQWEADNAINLPPAIRQSLGQSSQMAQQINDLKQMMTQMAQQGTATTQAAQQQLSSAQGQRADAGRQQIMNNLQKVQQKYQLPDEAEKDFMTFVQERGYMIEDLLDSKLADTLGSDFKAVMQSPEIDRLRQIQQRRQAFTGTASPSPTGGGSTPPAAPTSDDQFINEVTNQEFAKRNMGA